MAEVVRLSPNSSDDPFSQLWALGYRRLVPIIPPGAPISERSNLAARIAKGDDARGKAPGVRWPDGSWSGYDWLASDPDERDLVRWGQMGAGAGIKTGEGLNAIDADTLHADRAAIVKRLADEMFGPLPTRIGQNPKALYVFRTDEPIPYQRIEFGELNEKGSRSERVEILSGGRQFVAYGVHPKTKAPYRWTSKLLPFDELPVFPAAKVAEFLARLAELLPAATPIIREGAKTDVDQASLVGDLAQVQKAVRATPNTSALFPTRESYRDFGYAIKAALPEHPGEALDLFQDWCQRWTGGTNEPEIAEADWRRMKPPFRRGASWLFDLAGHTSEGRWTRGEQWFEPPHETASSLFPEDAPVEICRTLRTFTAASLFGKPVPEQAWLVRDVIPAHNVTLLGGDGGTGKSLLSLQLAEAVASDGAWLGLETASGPVLFLSAEDEEEELHRRTSRVRPDLEALGGLVFAPLAGEDAVLMAPGRDGLLVRTALWAALEATIDEIRPVLLVLDTLADLFGGDEIKKIHARQFVAELRGLALRKGLTVLLLYHPSQSGMASGSGTSGNVAWNNSVRSRLYFTDDEEDRDLRHLEVMKANRAQKGEKIGLRYHSGKFIREGAIRERMSKAEADEAAERVFLKMLARFGSEGRNVSHAPNASNYAPRIFASHASAEGLEKAHFAKAMDRLFASGRVQIETYGKKTQPKERLIRVQDVSDEAEPGGPSDLFFGLK